MPTLHALQIDDFRQLCGDLCAPEVISVSRIQWFYDKALLDGGDEQETEALTCVLILRRLLGDARLKIDENGEVNVESRSQIFDHTEKLLKYYEGIAGIGGAGSMKVGSLSLDLDYDEEDAEANL